MKTDNREYRIPMKFVSLEKRKNAIVKAETIRVLSFFVFFLFSGTFNSGWNFCCLNSLSGL
jgi:hypothetical protein